MRRIVFTTEDFLRTGIMTVGPLAETMHALRVLQTPRTSLLFDGWRHRVRARVGGRGRVVAPLFRPDSVLDVVAAVGAVTDFDEGAAQLEDLHRDALNAELAYLGQATRLPAWTADLARGERSARVVLAEGLRDVYDAAVATVWPQMRAHLDTDRERYAQALSAGGLEQLFGCLAPYAYWRAPALELAAEHPGGTAQLDGRGLLIVPSVFCLRPEYSWVLGDGGPSLLFVPALRDTMTAMRVLSAGVPTGRALEALLGRSRAAVLDLIAAEPAITTGSIAARLRCSAASASEHATVLREAGLVRSERRGNTVRHTATELGRTMLDRAALGGPGAGPPSRAAAIRR